MVAKIWLLAVIVLLGVTGGAAQEPSYFYGNGAMRYAEAPGYFHYVFPCGVKEPSSGAAGFQGICWPVYAGRRLMADGSPDAARPVPGVLLVTSETVHFVPNEAKDGGVIPDLRPEEIAYSYDDRQVVASMKVVTVARAGTYSFAFRGVCDGCTPGRPVIDPGKKAQLDEEYAEFRRSLTEYAAVSARVKERAAVVEVRVGPKVEPGLDDVPEAMGLYSEMNQKLAPMCSEAAKACVTQFSAYQACKKTDLHAECGDAPSCEVSCALKQSDFLSLKATVCRSPKEKTSMLVPDWSAAGERLRAQQKANREKNGPPPALTEEQWAKAKERADELLRQLKEPAGQGGAPATAAPAPQKPSVDFMGRPSDPAAGCTVESGYAMAMMSASGPQGPFGLLGPAGMGSGNPRISAGVAASNIVSKVEPVYPALAKAAHVSGTVVLRVLITETGEVTDLTVVSGPPLLQTAAVDAVKQWRYKPYVLNGVVRKVDTLVYVNFNFGVAPAGTAPAK